MKKVYNTIIIMKNNILDLIIEIIKLLIGLTVLIGPLIYLIFCI